MSEEYIVGDKMTMRVTGPLTVETDEVAGLADRWARLGRALVVLVDVLARTTQAVQQCASCAQAQGVWDSSGLGSGLAADYAQLEAQLRLLAAEMENVRGRLVTDTHACEGMAVDLARTAADYRTADVDASAVLGTGLLLGAATTVPSATAAYVLAVAAKAGSVTTGTLPTSVPGLEVATAGILLESVALILPTQIGRIRGPIATRSGLSATARTSRVIAGIIDAARGRASEAIPIAVGEVGTGRCSVVTYPSADVVLSPAQRTLVTGLAQALGTLDGEANAGRVTSALAPACPLLPRKKRPLTVPPRTLPDLIHALDTPASGTHVIRILKHTTHDKTSWTVVVPGTKKWTIGTSETFDLEANLRENGALPSSQEVAVAEAMRQAGIAADEPVEFVGHSQGGAVVSHLVSDPLLAQRYSIASALTIGGNVGRPTPIAGAQMLAIESGDDIVPYLDGSVETRPHPGLVSVQARIDPLHAARVSPGDWAGAGYHNRAIYADIGRQLEKGASPSVNAWLDHRRKAMGWTEATTTQSLDYAINR
ncbi:MAG: hypothetical protein Q4B10_06240 [Actinomycetaceae bacterium]|nr:hypothetical protein [Actinomycetaceae bacterium]